MWVPEVLQKVLSGPGAIRGPGLLCEGYYRGDYQQRPRDAVEGDYGSKRE